MRDVCMEFLPSFTFEPILYWKTCNNICKIILLQLLRQHYYSLFLLVKYNREKEHNKNMIEKVIPK